MVSTANPILQLQEVSISYTPGKNAVNRVNARIEEKKNHGHHGALRLREKYSFTSHKPNARTLSGYPHYG